VRRLLLRTSILGRVNGPLADLLTGDSGGERVLQDLAQANAFTVPLDADRAWFRYHQMFAGLLQLELRRTAPAETAALHKTACAWFAEHGYPVEAIRHAQAAGAWDLAAALLADHWPALHLDGQDTTVHELLACFPAATRASDPELAALAAADEMERGSLQAAERYLAVADGVAASVPEGRRGQFQLLLGVARLMHARRRGNRQAVAEQARQLQAAAEAAGSAQSQLGEELRALALISVSGPEIWAGRYAEAYEHLDEAIALARRAGRPSLEFSGLAELAMAEIARPAEWPAGTGGPLTRTAERARQAIDLAELHGWTSEPDFSLACTALAFTLVWQGRPGQAQPWIDHAERTVRAEAEPGAAAIVTMVRGIAEGVRGQHRDALTAFQVAERLAAPLDAPNPVAQQARALQIFSLVLLGNTGQAEQVLGGLADRDRERVDLRVSAAALRLAQGDPEAAVVVLAPVLDGSASAYPGMWLARAFLLEALARDALGDQGAAAQALERALDLVEPDGALLPFLVHPAPGLLERHARRRTAHAALIAEILGLLAGNKPAPPPAGPRTPVEPLSESELRVLRYLPTNLSASDIGGELFVSVNTVKTHIRNVYAKLGTHRRAEAVTRARDLGLLAPSARSAR